MNSTTGYTDGYRQLYEWQTQLSCLEDRVKARGQQVNLRTDDVLARLSSAILVPSFNSVNWTDKMKQTFTLVSVLQILLCTQISMSSELSCSHCDIARKTHDKLGRNATHVLLPCGSFPTCLLGKVPCVS